MTSISAFSLCIPQNMELSNLNIFMVVNFVITENLFILRNLPHKFTLSEHDDDDVVRVTYVGALSYEFSMLLLTRSLSLDRSFA
jgi:hypothetical protein